MTLGLCLNKYLNDIKLELTLTESEFEFVSQNIKIELMEILEKYKFAFTDKKTLELIEKDIKIYFDLKHKTIYRENKINYLLNFENSDFSKI